MSVRFSHFFGNLFSYHSESGDNPHKNFWGWVISTLALIILLIFVIAAGRGSFFTSSLLSTLPGADEAAPLIVVDAAKGEFPLELSRLFVENSIISPAGTSPVSTLLPLLNTAKRSALVINERANGLAMYAAFSLTHKEQTAFAAGKLPQEWAVFFSAPEIVRTDRKGVFQIRANNLSSPLYLEIYEKQAYLTDSISDMDRIISVRTGDTPGLKQKWTLNRGWGGHMLLSNGGVIRDMYGNAGGRQKNASDQIRLEAAWRSSKNQNAPRQNQSEAHISPAGEARWRVTGLEKLLDRNFAKHIRPHDWSGEELYIPDPLLLSFGINLPNPGKNMNVLPTPLKFLADQMTKLGMKHAETQNILTGPAVLSLGGRTQILWFELPGIVLDIPHRGKSGFRLIDAFWSELFMGAESYPLSGYTHGGTTDLPFSVIAAGNDRTTILGLTSPLVERNSEVKRLLAKEKKSIGWLFADLPKLGTSLADMPSVNAFLSEEDDMRPIDSESTEQMKNAMNKLGKVFVVWDSGSSGHAIWYH